VASKLCEHSKSYRLTFLYAYWDIVRSAPLKPHSRVNAALLLRQLFSQQMIDLTVFKPVNWLHDMDAAVLDFLNLFFSNLIADASVCSADVLRAQFQVGDDLQKTILKRTSNDVSLFFRFAEIGIA
jgi:hypothetical protein